ncbi:MAG TPA: DUF4390 domain-containing protein [Gemmatimonadaceae bacterium]
MRRAVLLAALLWAGSLPAQRQPRLEFTLPPTALLAREGPTVRALDVLSDPETKSLLESGFPARLHFRVELWSAGRVFDALTSSEEWDLFVYYEALGKKYRVVRVERDGDAITSAGQFNTFDDMIDEVERPQRVHIKAPAQRSRQYYIGVLDVESLSLTDLDEVERWLRGELQPAVRGDGNPGTALGRGIRRVFVRLLGAERRNLQARSRTFVVQP